MIETHGVTQLMGSHLGQVLASLPRESVHGDGTAISFAQLRLPRRYDVAKSFDPYARGVLDIQDVECSLVALVNLLLQLQKRLLVLKAGSRTAALDFRCFLELETDLGRANILLVSSTCFLIVSSYNPCQLSRSPFGKASPTHRRAAASTLVSTPSGGLATWASRAAGAIGAWAAAAAAAAASRQLSPDHRK